ncbi:MULTISPECIES: hypothetical protein [unclassified Nocardioides]|uniref:hypothetical protein n=1 Tax=unclassified Nocardioides TaxID=2615069 RepID=UPI0006F98BC3|nr:MULTISPECIES: hypothetical protein [unclassified Nocardioides]KRA32708.1 hypothetical protein ASD81_14405 [Nocardioides sp. Root614]KRA89360.1 hypothetical protein ASD84_14670 [Nocardioides sp. Root682]
MNDIDHDPYLGPALRDRVRSESPDLEHLAAASLAAGTRLRRRRRVGVTAGAVAGVAVIALATSQMGGGTTASDPDFAGTPSASAPAAPTLHVGQVLDLEYGLKGTVRTDEAGLYELGASTLPGTGTGFVLVVDGPTGDIEDWWSESFGTLTQDWPGIKVAVSMAKADELGMLGKVDKAPVTVGAGWTCEWFLVDDKASCESPDGGVASLVIRDAADRASWLGSSDKGDDPSVYTTKAHDGIFISVQGGQGTTNAEIQELGESLTWVD